MRHRNRLFGCAVIAVVLVLGLSAQSNAALPRVERMVLPNGLVVLFSEEHSLPFVVFDLVLDAGSRRDPKGREGLAHLTAKSLLLGTKKTSANQLNESLDTLGAAFSVSASEDLVSADIHVLKKNMMPAISLFFGAFMSPAFPDLEVGNEKGRTMGAIQAADEDPMTVAEKKFLQTLYPDNPYGHPVRGTKDSLSGLKRNDVAGFYKTFYHPANAILAVVGDLTPNELKTQVLPLFLKWPQVKIPEPILNSHYIQGPKASTVDRKVAQASIVMGNVGVDRRNQDYYPLQVMSYILGGGFGSYLLEEIRVKKGLAYSVSSAVEAEKYGGSFQIVLQTKNSSAAESLSLALEQMRRIRTEPVSDADLSRAKSYLTGSFPMRFDSQTKLAAFLTLVEYFGLGLDYPEKYPGTINRVSTADVQRVARQYLHPDQVIVSIVGDLKEAQIERVIPKGGGE
jgi:zinc protease